MRVIASQITSLTIVYSRVYSGADQRKHQSSTSLAFVRGIHRWPVNSTSEFPSQMASIMENVSIWWCSWVSYRMSIGVFCWKNEKCYYKTALYLNSSVFGYEQLPQCYFKVTSCQHLLKVNFFIHNWINCYNKANLRDLVAATSLVISNRDSNNQFFSPCDLEIWWMTLENNMAPLLYYFKLCASFQIHRCSKTWVSVRKCSIRVKIGDFFPTWP